MNTAPTLPSVHIVAFSGEGISSKSNGVAGALRERLNNLRSGDRRLLAFSSLGCPGDHLFARAALDLEIPLVVVLPGPVEDLRAGLSVEARAAFDQVLEKVLRVEVMSDLPQGEGGISIGEKLVEEADVLLAASDGVENGAGKRTAQTIAYATFRGRPVISILAAGDALTIREIKPDSDPAATEDSIASLKKQLGEAPPAVEIPDELDRYFHACDDEATRTAPQLRRHFQNIVLANAIATVAGSVDSSFPQTMLTGGALNAIKFGCVLLGMGILLMLRHRQSQSYWLDLRLRAELCRSAMATWLSPRGIEPLAAEQVPELRGLIQALRYYRAVHRPRTAVSLEHFKADYGARRLLDQLDYFRNQANQASQLSSWFTPLYWVFTVLSLATSVVSVVYQTVSGHSFISSTVSGFTFNFASAMAPALASWLLAFQAIRSVGRRRARFREMERLMHFALADLVRAQSWDEACHSAKRSEKLLLGEVLEWYSFTKYGK